MKMKLAFAGVLVLSGCGPSREAMMALQDMQILENNDEATISYKSLSGWGNDLTLNDVEVRAPKETAIKIDMALPAPDADPVEIEKATAEATAAAKAKAAAAPTTIETIARAKSAL